MNGCIFYVDSKLEEKIRSRKIIPFRTFPNQKYIPYHWYYLSYDNILFKVNEVVYGENGLMQNIYCITDDNMQHCLSTELSAYDYTFKADNDNIAEKDIINSGEAYSGAEIIYWFFINNKSGKKYEVFWKYLNWSSKFRLKDSTKYKIYGETNSKKQFTSGRIEAVRKSPKTYRDSEDKERDDAYMYNLIQKDRQRMADKHRSEM